VTTSIDALRSRAERGLAESRATLEQMAEALDRNGWPGIEARLRADHPTVDDYLATFEREWHACRQACAAAEVVTWPDYPLRYATIPTHTRDVAPQLYYLFYRSPAPFDGAPAHEAVVPTIDPADTGEERRRRLEAANRSVIRLNHVIHHGALGHHVQNWFASRSASRIGQIAAVDCASRIGLFCGGTMAEGWACYAVDLMEEIGHLTALERVAHQHSRVRLLARACLDIGIHGDGWTTEQASRFWQQALGASAESAAGEVTRASMFPATAIMYWLGTTSIHDLRAAMVAREGAGFSLRRFHDRVLAHGSLPVTVVTALMLDRELPC
jgi:hypothetical protein